LLGIPLKTRHREVAPNQYEFAPMFGHVIEQTDNNLMVMQIAEEVAPTFGLRALFTEKPFEGVNGSGKHNNWSISTKCGAQLLNPIDLTKKMDGDAKLFPIVRSRTPPPSHPAPLPFARRGNVTHRSSSHIDGDGTDPLTAMQKLRIGRRDFGSEIIAHAAVSRRPPNSLSTIVSRTECYTYAANVWDLSLVQGPFSAAPCQTLPVRYSLLAHP
jgi:hypothetical protein